jgi:hypothetical protein
MITLTIITLLILVPASRGILMGILRSLITFLGVVFLIGRGR